jgi:hypothetical protein
LLKNKKWANVPIIVSENELKDAINVEATKVFASKLSKPIHYYHTQDFRVGVEVTNAELKTLLLDLSSGKTNQRMGKLPLVVGMPVMICHNFNVDGEVVNGCMGKLVKVRYRIDHHGVRHVISCVVASKSVERNIHPNLGANEVVALQNKVKMEFKHPYSGLKCTFQCKQLPVIPAFAITAHKSQGQTMKRVIIDLQKCSGTESPYIMISRAKSLDGLLVLHPFEKSKISCHQSQSMKNEFVCLEQLQLQTIMVVGTERECDEAEHILKASFQIQNVHMLNLPSLPPHQLVRQETTALTSSISILNNAQAREHSLSSGNENYLFSFGHT